MPIPLPNLDDRSFTDLVDEGKRLIPGLAPSWTDHNPSDPGITFIELFAFITEMLMYRADRVSENNKRAFVKLLRGNPEHSFAKSIDEEIRLAVLDLRVEQRAVTPADFERLAMNIPRVARSYCMPRRKIVSGAQGPARQAESNQDAPACVTVLIIALPTTAELPPPEDGSLATAVLDDLNLRRLLTTCLYVAFPRYLKVAVNITCIVFSDRKESEIIAKIKEKLAAYFHPLSGGRNGQGWSFGQALYVSDLYAFLDGIEGVDYIRPNYIPPNNDKVPELVAENSLTSARRITEGSGTSERLIGVRLEQDELIDFDLVNSHIFAKRHAD